MFIGRLNILWMKLRLFIKTRVISWFFITIALCVYISIRFKINQYKSKNHLSSLICYFTLYLHKSKGSHTLGNPDTWWQMSTKSSFPHLPLKETQYRTCPFEKTAQKYIRCKCCKSDPLSGLNCRIWCIRYWGSNSICKMEKRCSFDSSCLKLCTVSPHFPLIKLES